MVARVEPLAPLAAVAVDRERQSVERVRDEEGHELLRVLALAVGIGAARDAGVETVGADVREHLQVSPGLGGAVGGRGPQRVVLVRAAAEVEVAVHLVRGHLDVANVRLPRPFEQGLRAENVGVDEVLRRLDRAVDVRLGGEVDHGLAAFAGTGDGFRIGDVADDELGADALEIGRIPGIGELVEHHDLVAVSHEPPNEVRADEAGAAGDEHAHRGEG